MSQKNKLFKFAQNETFPHLFQPKLMYGTPDEFELKGKWASEFFHNDNPITVELGCGKGEYSVAMAKEIPTGNFIGVDIKGARMWRGASDSLEMEMKNELSRPFAVTPHYLSERESTRKTAKQESA